QRDTPRAQAVEQSHGVLDQPQKILSGWPAETAGERGRDIMRMHVAGMEIHHHRESRRQDRADAVDQHLIKHVAPLAAKLQEGSGIDRESDEIESGTAQRLQFGRLQFAIREWRKNEGSRW